MLYPCNDIENWLLNVKSRNQFCEADFQAPKLPIEWIIHRVFLVYRCALPLSRFNSCQIAEAWNAHREMIDTNRIEDTSSLGSQWSSPDQWDYRGIFFCSRYLIGGIIMIFSWSVGLQMDLLLLKIGQFNRWDHNDLLLLWWNERDKRINRPVWLMYPWNRDSLHIGPTSKIWATSFLQITSIF